MDWIDRPLHTTVHVNGIACMHTTFAGIALQYKSVLTV